MDKADFSYAKDSSAFIFNVKEKEASANLAGIEVIGRLLNA
ncbi:MULTISPECIES: hypothetical protein [Bacillus]|nr:hypothetical protein [Bacillus pumilus]